MYRDLDAPSGGGGEECWRPRPQGLLLIFWRGRGDNGTRTRMFGRVLTDEIVLDLNDLSVWEHDEYMNIHLPIYQHYLGF